MLYILVLLYVGSSLGQVCEENEGVCTEGFEDHEKYCNQYYQCTADLDLSCIQNLRTCPDGQVWDRTICSIPEFATTCPQLRRSAQFLARSSRSTGAKASLDFNEVIMNEQDLWDTTGHFMKTRTTQETYLVSLSAGVRAGIGLYNQLFKNGNELAALTRTSTNHNNFDTVSRDMILKLTAGDVLRLNSSGDLEGDARRLTSFSSFCISNMTGLPIGTADEFSVARDSPMSGDGNINYDKVLTAEGAAFNPDSNLFTAQVSGNYYFCFSVGVEAGQSVNVELHKNGAAFASAVRLASSHNGIDTVSRCIFMPLDIDDTVRIVNAGGGTAYSTESGLETSFSGFQYYQLAGTQAAWSVTRKVSYSINTELVPVPFENVLINLGNSWRAATSTVVIPTNGKYFIHISSGARQGARVGLRLQVNSADVLELYRVSNSHNGIDTLSRSAILQLSRNNVLRIANTAGRHIHSDDLQQASFAGFFLYA